MNLDALKVALKNTAIPWEANVSLKSYTSLKIGGCADLLVKPATTEEIQTVIALANTYQIPYFMLGNGSNTLVLDHGVTGMVILLAGNFSQIMLSSPTTITCDAGISLMDVCLFARKHHLTGLEFAYGIPASVGGALYMNAGAYGGEMKDVVISCTYLNEQNILETKSLSELELRYRHSYFTDKKLCIISVTFQLQHGDLTEIDHQMQTYLKQRQLKQPLEYPSAGSTFKRPNNHYASALIDQCGLKGYRIGDAQVSEKHAGFLINAGKATSEEFLNLIQHVKEVVYTKTGYQLECEMKILE